MDRYIDQGSIGHGNDHRRNVSRGSQGNIDQRAMAVRNINTTHVEEERGEPSRSRPCVTTATSGPCPALDAFHNLGPGYENIDFYDPDTETVSRRSPSGQWTHTSPVAAGITSEEKLAALPRWGDMDAIRRTQITVSGPHRSYTSLAESTFEDQPSSDSSPDSTATVTPRLWSRDAINTFTPATSGIPTARATRNSSGVQEPTERTDTIWANLPPLTRWNKHTDNKAEDPNWAALPPLTRSKRNTDNAPGVNRQMATSYPRVRVPDRAAARDQDTEASVSDPFGFHPENRRSFTMKRRDRGGNVQEQSREVESPEPPVRRTYKYPPLQQACYELVKGVHEFKPSDESGPEPEKPKVSDSKWEKVRGKLWVMKRKVVHWVYKIVPKWMGGGT